MSHLKDIIIVPFYFLPRYRNTRFLYSSYSFPNVAVRYFSSCKICKCSMTIANKEKNNVSGLKYISRTPIYIKSKPKNAGLRLNF